MKTRKESSFFDFYENIKQGDQVLSAEESEVAIETLKLAKQTNPENIKSNTLSVKSDSDKNVTIAHTEPPKAPEEDIYRNKTLPLPSYDWLVTKHDGKPASNTFTGSCRKDVTKGSFSTTTFNYKVSVSDVGKETAKSIVNCFLEKPWYKGAGRETIAQAEFECSAFGLTEAMAWLNNEWKKFMEDDKND